MAPSSRPGRQAELLRILRAANPDAPGRQARLSVTASLAGSRQTAVDRKARYALRRIHRTLARLTPTERLALVLRYMATLEIDEVAALLAVPANTVRRWVNGAPKPREETRARRRG